MANYKNRSNTVLVEKYKSASTGTTKTFTFPADDFVNTAYYELQIQVGATAALDLRMTVNGSSASLYTDDGYEITGGTQTLIDIATADYWEITAGDPLGAASHAAFIIVKLSLPKTINQRPCAIVTGTGSNTSVTWNTGHQLIETHATISSITIAVSTSSWQAGTRMTLYRITA